jgi:hypothetical protein
MWNTVGSVPRFGRFPGAPDATLGDIAQQVYDKWKLEPAHVDFGLQDLTTEVAKGCPLSTKLSEIDFDSHHLMVGLKGQFIVVGVSDAVPSKPAQSVITITFQEMGKDEKFSLEFGDSDLVKDAIDRVADHLRKPSREIALLRGGMQLRSEWQLTNVHLENSDITVLVGED